MRIRVDVGHEKVMEITTMWGSLAYIASYQQRRLDMRHRTRDYFAFQWPLIACETGVDHAK